MKRIAEWEYVQAMERLNDPEYLKANSQWADYFVKRLNKKIKVIIAFLAVLLFLWAVIITLFVISSLV